MTDPGPSKSKWIYRPFKLSKQTGRQFLGLPGSQELFLQTKPGHRFRSPFGDPAGILPHHSNVPHRHTPRVGIKICWRDRTDGAIAIDESMPHRVSATLERQLGAGVDADVRSEITEAAVVEIEE